MEYRSDVRFHRIGRNRYKDCLYLIIKAKKNVKFFVFCSNRQDLPAFFVAGASVFAWVFLHAPYLIPFLKVYIALPAPECPD